MEQVSYIELNTFHESGEKNTHASSLRYCYDKLIIVTGQARYIIKALTGYGENDNGATNSPAYITLHGDVASCAETLLEVNNQINTSVQIVYYQLHNKPRSFVLCVSTCINHSFV